MWSWLRKILCRQKPIFKSSRAPRLVFTVSCITAMRECLGPEIQRGYEGIAYLLGLSDGNITLAVAAVRPNASTTPGSFNVSLSAMSVVVRTAGNLGLQVVGQAHTHPDSAYHSDGDVLGARISYTGYVSVVLPDYGRWLPQLAGAAIYFFKAGEGFIPLEPSNITIVPGRLQ